VREALGAKGSELIVGVRAPVVQRVLREAARVYFGRVQVDLGALDADARGRVDRDTFLGRMKVGEWRLEIHIAKLRVPLRAKNPKLRVLRTNELELQLSLEAAEAAGQVALRFEWDSASIANLVCRDFEVSRELEGRTLRQEHTVGGTFRLSGGPDAVRAEPLESDDVIYLKLDLAPESWDAVAQALESQDSLGRCGLILDPQKALEQLKARAAEGFRVKLPSVLFKSLRIPGTFEHTARIDGRPVAVELRARAVQVTSRAVWSRAGVGVEKGDGGSGAAPDAALAPEPEGGRGRHAEEDLGASAAPGQDPQ
jgi:hypothetical protein